VVFERSSLRALRVTYILDNITHYWLNEYGGLFICLYWENKRVSFAPKTLLSVCGECLSRQDLYGVAGVGRSGRIPTLTATGIATFLRGNETQLFSQYRRDEETAVFVSQ